MYKDNQEDRNKTVEFMKGHGIYNPMLSTQVMQYSHEVYHYAIEAKQLTIEELREQFERQFRTLKPSDWQGYKQCAIDCGILKG